MRPPASQNALLIQVLYRAWTGAGLSAFAPKGAALTVILIGLSAGGCSFSRGSDSFAKMSVSDYEVTGALRHGEPVPTDSDLAFARNAASDVLTKGDKDSSQPWQNPQTGARGSVTPLAQAYSGDDGRTCRDFLASYVRGGSESWLQGEACRGLKGRWEVRQMRPWRRT